MLSVPKEEQRLHIVQGSLSTPPSRSFDKILDSLQDLRLTLEEVTLEEIVATEDKAKQLIQRLSSIEKDLVHLSSIKQYLTKIKGSVEIQNDPVYEFTKQELRRKSLQGSSVPLPKNLILFPGPNRHLKESAFTNVGTPPSQTSRFDAKDDPDEKEDLQTVTTPFLTPTLPVAFEHDSDQQVSGATTLSPMDQQRAQLDAKPVDEVQSVVTDRAGEDSDENVALSLPDHITEEARGAGSLTLDPVPDEEEGTVHTDAPSQEVQSVQTEATRLSPIQSNSTVPNITSVEFDQKLLKDLIKDYGEFVTFSNLPLSEIHEATGTPNLELLSKDPGAALVDNELAKLPRQLAYKNEGDLDRTLKKLIKDYGEYDLYSHRSPLNLKKVAIVTSAVILLFLFFSFFYFRHSTNSSTNLTSTQAETFSAKVVSDSARKTSASSNPKKENTSDSRLQLLQSGSDGDTASPLSLQPSSTNRKE